MRKKDSIAYGSKAANLGEMLNARDPGVIVPDGFSVPFYWYDKFMKDNGFDKMIDDLMDDNDFVHNPRVRRQKLEEFRTAIQNGKFDDDLRRQIIAKWKTQLGGKPVFVRSSSNSEDLPNFQRCRPLFERRERRRRGQADRGRQKSLGFALEISRL